MPFFVTMTFFVTCNIAVIARNAMHVVGLSVNGPFLAIGLEFACKVAMLGNRPAAQGMGGDLWCARVCC
jgi:hypothetical protein